MTDRMRPLAAEAIGTFCLVFAGTSAIVVDATGGGVSHVGVALVFGLVVFAMIAAVGAPFAGKLVAVAACRCSQAEGCCGCRAEATG